VFCTYCATKNQPSFNFCSSCGKQNVNSATSDTRTDLTRTEKIEFVLRPKGVVLSDDSNRTDNDLPVFYKNMVGSKYFDYVIFDAIFTNKCVLIRPVSKTPIYMTLLGALISPSLAQTADLLNRKISSFLTESAESLVGKSIDVDVLNNLPIWYLSNLVEVKQSLPSLWNAAGTIMTFKGAFNVKEHQKDTSLNLVFEGSATPSKKQFLEFPHLAKLCNFDLSKIMKI
jgi:hypothetical protein